MNGASFQPSSAVICSLSFLFSYPFMGCNCSPFLALDRVITYPDDLHRRQSCGYAALIIIFSLSLLSRGSLLVELGRGYNSSRDGCRVVSPTHALFFSFTAGSLSSTVKPASISCSYFITYFSSDILLSIGHSYTIANLVCFDFSSAMAKGKGDKAASSNGEQTLARNLVRKDWLTLRMVT